MRHFPLSLALITLLALCLPPAARSAPYLQDIVKAPITLRADGSHLSLPEIQAAIIEACNTKHWVPQITAPGKISATILVRGVHHAEISIPFDESSYSIIYVSSRNLDYKEYKSWGGEVKREIHRNYNKWVEMLSQTIAQQLAVRVNQPINTPAEDRKDTAQQA